MNGRPTHKLSAKRKFLFTKKLRQIMTPEEKILWQELRNRKCGGMKFRRQVNVNPYIADFLCWQHKLIIEVDGGIHKNQLNHDRERDDYLRSLHFKVLRFTNDEIRNKLPFVLEKIRQAIFIKQPSSPSPQPMKDGSITPRLRK